MGFLSKFAETLLLFLFPKSDQLLRFESLSPERLLSLLPPARFEDGPDTLAVFDYQDPKVKEVVWEVKYNGNSALAETLGVILYDVIESELHDRNVFEKTETVILMPMPISDKRRFERGWNQSELLCAAIKKCDAMKHYKYLPRQLVKIRHTESQTRTADKHERAENLKGSMLVQHAPAVTNEFVVLVDDVLTTGSTFKEAKCALAEAGAHKVLCVAIAH
jgi:competence protein ComFC